MSIVICITTLGQSSAVQAAEYKNEELASSTSYEVNGVVITFEVTSHWDTGYNAQVTLTNVSECKIDNWKLKCFTADDIINIWNAKADKVAGNTYVFSNLGWNQDINSGESISFGYTAGNAIENLPAFEIISNRITTVDSDKYIAEYVVSSEWNTGFTGNINITNLSDEVLEDWKVSIYFDGEINSIWNATIMSVKDGVYDIDNNGYNGNIQPKQTVSFGFIGTKKSEGSPVITTISAYDETSEVTFNSDVEMMDLPDGKIEKAYIENAIYPRLINLDLPIDNVCLADDYDGDGLSLIQEYEYGTNPFEVDTDDDGLTDYEEVMIYFTNPWKSDTDKDGLTDGTEVSCGLNPLVADTDGDGVDDGLEETTQKIRLINIEKYSLEIEGTIPSITISGKGEYSNKIEVEAEKYNTALTEINCLVGTVYDFKHDEIDFESSILSFMISDEILKNHDIENLAIAYYDDENNEIVILDSIRENNTISANVEHYSKYMVIDTQTYLDDIYFNNTSYSIDGGIADVVVVMDTTGSMGGTIQNVKAYVETFAKELTKEKIDIRLGLVEYRDIYEDGFSSTVNYGWFTSVNAFKDRLSDLYASGGGDSPESAIDAIYSATDMKFRTGVQKYIVLITDAEYKIGTVKDSTTSMEDAIEKLTKKDISASVVTATAYYSQYSNLTNSTDGILANIYSDFAIALKPLISKMKERSDEGCWVRLTNGSVVFLDKDPDEQDWSVDTDDDGIPDLCELGEKKTCLVYDNTRHMNVPIESWTFYTNPVKPDTDGDGLQDSHDLNPNFYDVVPVEEDENHIKFNTGHEWKMINDITAEEYCQRRHDCEILQYHVDVEFWQIRDIVYENCKTDFLMEELIYIAVDNIYGLQMYMDGCKYKNVDKDSAYIFKQLTGREPKKYQHTGILWWQSWEEVPAEIEGSFWNGQVLTEADFSINLNFYYTPWDIKTLLSVIVVVGALIISVVLIVEATPVVIANIEALEYCISTLGVYNGINFYLTYGANEALSYKDGLITVVQYDMSDGDCDALELAEAVKIQSKASSTILRKNLIKAGNEVPEYRNAAHHIVAGNSAKAAAARAILEKYEIDINDAINGVFLPIEKGVSEALYHPTLHTNAYYDLVNNLLKEATCKQDVIDILKYIAEKLLDGTLMK